MGVLVTILILVAAVIDLLPAIGVASSERTQACCGVALQDPNLAILMRHRAVLFGIVGGLLVASAFHPPLRPAGYAAGFVAMLSFVWIARLAGGANPAIRRVAVVDLVGSAALFAAVVFDCAARAGKA